MVLPARAAVVITPNATTTGGVLTSTMPGSASDYIVFNGSDYTNTTDHNNPPTSVSEPEANYNELTSFFVAGGLQASSDGTAITSPSGASLTNVGALAASSNFSAFALRPGTETANLNQNGGNGDNTVPPTGLNPNFNYNDFNVYIFFSDVGGAVTDDSIGLDVRTNNSLTFSPADVITVVDNNTTSGDIKYVEFNVQGLGTSLADGNNTDLVVSEGSPGNISYVNGISFESVPEPSTYAMLLGGFALLGFVIRRKASLLS
jgi:hypothetical protein